MKTLDHMFAGAAVFFNRVGPYLRAALLLLGLIAAAAGAAHAGELKGG